MGHGVSDPFVAKLGERWDRQSPQRRHLGQEAELARKKRAPTIQPQVLERRRNGSQDFSQLVVEGNVRERK